MDLLSTKIVTMVVLGLASFLIGVSTLTLRKVLGLHKPQAKRWQSFITSILLCFGGGVLLATCMLHILPEAREGMEDAQESLEINWLAELTFCIGFFLVYLMEELVHTTLQCTKHTEELHKAMSVRKSDSTCKTSHTCSEDTLVMPETVHSSASGHSHAHFGSGSSSSVARDFFTVLALSFHAVFEGMAVGLEGETQDVWALCLAISAHKFVITFCICLELIQSGATMLVFFSNLVTWSLVSPIGIGVGMMISEMASDNYHELTVAVMQGLSGGTILYVVMFEILQREKEKKISGIIQLFGIVLGFAAMMTLQIFGHDEDDSNGGQSEAQAIQNTTAELLKSLSVGSSFGLATE